MKLYQSENRDTVVEVVWGSNPDLTCNGAPMKELKAGTTDAALEKHVPAVTVEGSQIIVQVGSVLHPMTPEHYITSIGVKAGNLALRRDLSPSDAPKAVFELGDYHGPVAVYEYCNLHGLWKTDTTI